MKEDIIYFNILQLQFQLGIFEIKCLKFVLQTYQFHLYNGLDYNSGQKIQHTKVVYNLLVNFLLNLWCRQDNYVVIMKIYTMPVLYFVIRRKWQYFANEFMVNF